MTSESSQCEYLPLQTIFHRQQIETSNASAPKNVRSYGKEITEEEGPFGLPRQPSSSKWEFPSTEDAVTTASPRWRAYLPVSVEGIEVVFDRGVRASRKDQLTGQGYGLFSCLAALNESQSRSENLSVLALRTIRPLSFESENFPSLEKQIDNLFAQAAEETVEDGSPSGAILRLISMVGTCGIPAVEVIGDFILKGRVCSEVGGEILKWLGDMEHRKTYAYRRWLLEKALLECASPALKDGANVGLYFMGDPHAIPFLQKAIERSACPLLRKVFQQTLNKLENAKSDSAPQDNPNREMV